MPAMTSKRSDNGTGRVRVGVGGWNYAPWRGVFYPKGLKQADELAYAASHLTSIEINATHYRLQSPKSFRKWADATPDGFVFSVKGPRLVTNQKALAETGEFVQRFIEFRTEPSLATSSDRYCGSSRPSRCSTKTTSANFSISCPGPRRTEAQSRDRGAPCELQHAGLRQAAARAWRRRGLYRCRDLAEHPRLYRRCGLCPAAEGRRQT